GVMLGAPGSEHVEITLRKPFVGALVDGVERVYEAIAKGVGVDVERRMHEVGYVGPKHFIAGIELNGGTQALVLDLEPKRVEPLGGELAASAFDMHVALESIERDLTDHRIDHVL